MAEFKVTSSELKNKAQELRQVDSSFKTAVEELQTTEQQLLTMWDGEAKDAFDQAFKSDVGQMETFYQTIEKYCQALETDASTYEKAEQTNLQTATTRSYK